MKLKLSLILASIVVLAFSFQSCLKYYEEEKERENTAYSLDLQYSFVSELNLYNTEINLEAQYPPSTAPEKTIIKITSIADTTGLIYEISPEDNTTYNNFGDTWHEKRSILKLNIAERTSLEHKQIKVNIDQDVVHVDIDNGAFTQDLVVNSEPVFHIAFWNLVDENNTEATIFYYDPSLGSGAKPVVRLFSDADPTGFSIALDYNDPMAYTTPLPFTSYTADFYYNKTGVSNPSTYTIGAFEGQNIYIEYNGKTYYIQCFEEWHYPMPLK